MKRLALFVVSGGLLLVVVFGVSTGCLGYLMRVGSGQLSILCNRQPIAEAIQDPRTSPKNRAKLLHILEVRKFARDRLGLALGGSFTTYVAVGRSAAAWNVSASKPLAFVPRTWWFPIVGRVPYLGFFSREEARSAALDLEKEGWDVMVRPVAAYSTLGWFDDPILSSQLSLSDWYLTDLVIHETAHSTIWFPGDVSFNESFASFVGRTGALHYYRDKYGADSPIYRRQLAFLSEKQRISAIFRKYAGLLNRMYQSNISDKSRLLKKRELIAAMGREFLKQAGTFRIINTRPYERRTYNNANFLSYLRYDSGQAYFQSVFESDRGDWKRFLDKMRKLRELAPARRRLLLNSRPIRPKKGDSVF